MLSDKTIVLLANTDWYLANFRFDFACALKARGAQVHLVAPPGGYLDWLTEQGFRTHALELGADSFSLAANRKAYLHLVELYGHIQPDLVHHFTPRCVVLGSTAAKKTGVSFVVNALTGLGHVFTSNSLKSRLGRPILRRLLRKSLQGPGRAVIFQNETDREEVLAAGLADPAQCHLIRGSGVDPDKFAPSPVERGDGEIHVLFASRLLAEKGIHELVAAMRQVVTEFPKARLWIAGEPYAQNPTSLTEDEMRRIGRLPFVRLLGHVDNIAYFLAQTDIVALPSYREGTPKILLEAAACALPIVAADIAGCRGVVEEGVNGFLVPARQVPPLTEALLKLCADRELRRYMGERGREIILQGFTTERVNGKTLEVYETLLGGGAPD